MIWLNNDGGTQIMLNIFSQRWNTFKGSVNDETLCNIHVLYISLIYLKWSPTAMVAVTSALTKFKRWEPEPKYASGLKDILEAQSMTRRPVLL